MEGRLPQAPEPSPVAGYYACWQVFWLTALAVYTFPTAVRRTVASVRGVSGSQLREQLPVRTGFPSSSAVALAKGDTVLRTDLGKLDRSTCMDRYHYAGPKVFASDQSPPKRNAKDNWATTPPVRNVAAYRSVTLVPFTSAALNSMFVARYRSWNSRPT